jgi:protocatechuate 3,4-dioxygenase beta subunit
LAATPTQSRRPFYPTEFPVDTDNDLLKIGESAGLAQGRAVSIAGTNVDRAGRSPREAFVEIWQCDAQGRYRNPWDRHSIPFDAAFQDYGYYRVGADGNYWFRTIKPVRYPGRAPHIHFLIRASVLSHWSRKCTCMAKLIMNAMDY